MPNFIDITGQKFNRLTVLRREQGVSEVRWRCRCDCGNEVVVGSQSIRSGKTRSCGCYWKERMKGPNSPRWTTAAHTTKGGYVILANADYPGAKFPNQTKEHIVVMSRHLGRKLHRDESVHHRNGIRNDNRLENLELRASSHGRGQTIPDLVAWAREILARYDRKHA